MVGLLVIHRIVYPVFTMFAASFSPDDSNHFSLTMDHNCPFIVAPAWPGCVPSKCFDLICQPHDEHHRTLQSSCIMMPNLVVHLHITTTQVAMLLPHVTHRTSNIPKGHTNLKSWSCHSIYVTAVNLLHCTWFSDHKPRTDFIGTSIPSPCTSAINSTQPCNTPRQSH